MKKLLVLLMVLGLASMANAAIKIQVGGQDVGPEITMSPSDTIVVSIYNDYVSMSDRNFASYLDISPLSGGAFSTNGAALGSAAGDLLTDWSYDEYITEDYAEYTMNQNWNPATVSPVPSGTIFVVNFHCEAPGDVVLDLYDYHPGIEDIVSSVIIHQIPEPITMALLGLGGLFLRRRK